jgi:hypothetical protein
MLLRISILFLFICTSCSDADNTRPFKAGDDNEEKIKFEKTQWQVKDFEDYPFRNAMLDDLIDSRIIKPLNKDQILELLGQPDRINENYLYYRVAQTRLGAWPLHTKTLVIKIPEDGSENLVMIHE